MKKVRLLILFILNVGLLSVKAQTSSKSLLWEVSGNGLEQSSYLVGTFHMMCEEDFELKDKIKTALAGSNKLIMEIDYTNPAEHAAMAKLGKAEKPLSAVLNAEQTEKLNRVLGSYGKALQDVENFTPQALYSLIGSKAIPCAPEKVKYYEVELLKLALKDKKTIGGLETVEGQGNMMAEAYPLDETIRQLELGDAYEILTRDMIAAFKDENLSDLDNYLKDDRFMNERQEKLVLSDRNIEWVEKMPDLMKKEKVMFAVGSGHLWGKKGVINLLKEKGFVVTPVIK